MKVFSVIGFSKSGKTTTIENIIKELKKRKYSVGTVKDIHYEEFKIDTEGTNTYRHKKAGAELVTARGLLETDILFQEKLNIYEILKFYDQDFVILEGVEDINAPKIITGSTLTDIDKKMDHSTFLISGRIADKINEHEGIRAISSVGHIEELVDQIESTVFEILPDFNEECCNACGHSCKEMCKMIINGDKSRNDCIIRDDNISLSIDGNEVNMVPFVKKILRNAVLAVVSELDGFKRNGNIKIELGCDCSENENIHED